MIAASNRCSASVASGAELTSLAAAMGAVGGFDAGRRRSFGSRRRYSLKANADGSYASRPFKSTLCCLIWPLSSPETTASRMLDVSSVARSQVFRARLAAP